MAAPPNASVRHFSKQSFHQVQPAPTRRGVVDLIARVARQPRTNLGDFMRAVVVHHQVNVEPTWQIRIDLIEKPKELLMSVSAVATADRNTAGYIHSRKQRSDSVAFVVVRLPRRHAGRERQNRLRAIQRLNLALLVYAEHNSAVRRIQVQPHDVPHLLDELRVFGELEIFYPMRLQSEGAPNPHDRSLR